MPYALTLSLTSPNWSSALASRPAPETPLLASTTRSAIKPGAGQRGEGQQRRRRVAAGRPDDRDRRVDERRRARRDAAREGRRRRRRADRAGDARSHTSVGSRPGRRRRKSGPWSMTAVPAATRSGTIAAAAPWGRARKTASLGGSSAWTVRPVPARCGWIPAIGSWSRPRPTRPDERHVRVARQEADQLGADVPGRADDPDADRGADRRQDRPRARSGGAAGRSSAAGRDGSPSWA